MYFDIGLKSRQYGCPTLIGQDHRTKQIPRPFISSWPSRGLIAKQRTVSEEKSRLQRLMAGSSGRDVLLARVRLVLEHFHATCNGLSYRAQGLVLCASRDDVVRATQLARHLVAASPNLEFQQDDILGAFSGKVGGQTEKDLNGFYMRSAVDAKRAKILFVAHKFETGYDNAAVTCLYVLRKIDAGTLATQVLLRHCSKRPGKIRPITIDFANQDGQLLSVPRHQVECFA